MSCQKCLWPTINFSTLPSQLQYALQMNYGWRMKIQFASRVCMHETCTTDTCLWWTAERPTIHEVILLNKTLTMFFSLLFCHIQLNRIEFLLSFFFLLLFMFVLRFAYNFSCFMILLDPSGSDRQLLFISNLHFLYIFWSFFFFMQWPINIAVFVKWKHIGCWKKRSKKISTFPKYYYYHAVLFLFLDKFQATVYIHASTSNRIFHNTIYRKDW